MKIAIVTIAIDRECHRFNEETVYGRGTTEQYCARHGYDYHVIEQLPQIERPVAWYKLPVLKSLLGDYDWLMWLDTDTLIMDQTRRLEEWVEFPVESHFVFSHCVSMRINTGCWFVRNSEIARQRLQEWWDGPQEPFGPRTPATGTWWEQWPMNELFREEESVVRKDLSGIVRFSSRFHRAAFYREGRHWIAHFAGMQKYGMSIRDAMETYLSKIRR